jgi:Ca-activated chloride channel family protein
MGMGGTVSKLMSFYNGIFLFLLALVPIVIVAAYLHELGKAKARTKFAPPELFQKFAVVEPSIRSKIRSILVAIALGLLLVAFARPQGGEKVLEENVQGIEIVIAMDISRSMLARDLYPDRLSAIKTVVDNFIESSYGDRIGVVAFAGDAIVACPLTTDHGSAAAFVDRLNTDEPINPGTAIGSAIHLAVNRFHDSNAGRVIILLTDGENNKGVDPMQATQEAANAGVRIYTVGIGTPQGAPLPTTENRPLMGAERFRSDAKGDPIKVGLDESLLKQIANKTGGQYFSVANQAELRTLYGRISQEGQVQFQSRRTVRRDELAPYFLLLAALFLIMEAFYAYITPAEVAHAHAKT